MVKSLVLRSPYLQWILVRIFPRLRAWPVREWPKLLEQAQNSEFDRLERIGIIAAVVMSVSFLRPAMEGAPSIPFAYISQLVLALPLLALFAGPFFLRRIRRYLDEAATNIHAQTRGSSGERD